METVTMEAKLTLKLLEGLENTIKEKRHADRSEGGGDIIAGTKSSGTPITIFDIERFYKKTTCTHRISRQKGSNTHPSV